MRAIEVGLRTNFGGPKDVQAIEVPAQRYLKHSVLKAEKK